VLWGQEDDDKMMIPRGSGVAGRAAASRQAMLRGVAAEVSALALLAAFAHFHRDVRDEEHAEEAPGDDLEVGAHAESPAATANAGCIGSFARTPKVREGRKPTKRGGPIKSGNPADGEGLQLLISGPVT
jgi:hypothetical protein